MEVRERESVQLSDDDNNNNMVSFYVDSHMTLLVISFSKQERKNFFKTHMLKLLKVW